MVNFHNPAVLALDYWAFSKLCHTLGGLYLWEFLTTLDYEWRVISGRVRYRWSLWIYSFTRLNALISVILSIACLDLMTATNCQVMATLTFIFSLCNSAFSSLLVILRVTAIWDWNKGILALATIVWMTNVSFLIYCSIRIRAVWDPVFELCSIPDLKGRIPTFISMLITHLILLVIMLIGLLRLRRRSAGTCAIGLLLWKQGVILLLLATTAELPPVVFISLNLNEAFNFMFLHPSLIMISIATTWMYRSLSDFGSSIAMDSKPFLLPRIDGTVSNPKSAVTMATPPRQVEVSVHTRTRRETYPTSLTDENIVYINRDHPGWLQRDKPDCVNFDADAESGV